MTVAREQPGVAPRSQGTCHALRTAWGFSDADNGLRVHEVPIGRAQDGDSQVPILSTAVEDVRGLVRVARARVTGGARIVDSPRQPAPHSAHPEAVLAAREGRLGRQLVTFGLIGLASTAATAVLYAVFRSWSPPLIANLAALVLVNLMNTEANRRLTFAGAGASRQRVHLQALVVFALYYALTSGALLMLGVLVTRPSRWLEVTVLLAASAVGTAGRFLLLRRWVFPA